MSPINPPDRPEDRRPRRGGPKPNRETARLDLEELVSGLANLGRASDRGKVAEALLGVDETEVQRSVDSSIEWEVWDKETPINGVAPEVILARPDYAGGEIYLIRRGGQVIFLQPHPPGTDGIEPILDAEVERMAERQATEFADELIRTEILERVAAATPPADDRPRGRERRDA